jgi:hypothetical protein
MSVLSAGVYGCGMMMRPAKRGLDMARLPT